MAKDPKIDRPRVELPQAMTCGSCAKTIEPPYRGKPVVLLANELVIFCGRGCELTWKVENRSSPSW